jgi:hypothetical protein
LTGGGFESESNPSKSNQNHRQSYSRWFTELQLDCEGARYTLYGAGEMQGWDSLAATPMLPYQGETSRAGAI